MDHRINQDGSQQDASEHGAAPATIDLNAVRIFRHACIAVNHCCHLLDITGVTLDVGDSEETIAEKLIVAVMRIEYAISARGKLKLFTESDA